MNTKYKPSLQVDSHPYSIAMHKLQSLEAVGWVWEEFGLENEWCSEDDWFTVMSTTKPHIELQFKHHIRNIRIIYAEKVEAE